MSHTLKQFHDILLSTQTKLGEIEQEMASRKKSLLETLQAHTQMSGAPSPHASSPFASILSNISECMTSTLDKNIERVSSSLEQEEFISHFDRSLIVMVYGHVNCGKSTLGNFVSGIDFPPPPEDESYPDPIFYHHAMAGEGTRKVQSTPKEPGFGIDIQECTKEIQSFNMGGLSWVDTPGIGSLVEDNQSLAREYVQHAELILYLTSSDNPMTRADAEELMTQLGQSKRVMMVVTKFDDVDEDFDDEGNYVKRRTLKPESSRTEQSEWIHRSIQEAELQDKFMDLDICFLSTQLALDRLKTGDIQIALEDSGMDPFIKKLSSICSTQAVDLKTQGPRQRFDELIDQIIQGKSDEDIHTLKYLHAHLVEMRAHHEARHLKLNDLVQDIALQTRVAVMPELSRLIKLEAKRLEGTGREELFNKEARALRKEIEELTHGHLAHIIQSTLARELKETLTVLDSLHIYHGDWEDVHVHRVEEEIKGTDGVFKKAAGSAAGVAGGGYLGAKAGAVLGTMIAPGIGTAIGGFLGATLGGVVGGKGGMSLGEMFSRDIDIGVHSGTDVDEIIAAQRARLDTQAMKIATQNIAMVSGAYYEPVSQIYTRSIERIDTLIDAITDQKINTSHERHS